MNVERRTFGRTGLQVSVLGFGGAELGFDDGVTPERVAALRQRWAEREEPGWTGQQ